MKNLSQMINEGLLEESLNGFEKTISIITDDLDDRCKKASKDTRFKEFEFPTKEEIYQSISELFNNVIPSLFKKASVSSILSNYVAPHLKIYYTGKLSADELNDMRPRSKWGHITRSEDVESLNKEYFNMPDLIKLKTDTGTVQLSVAANGYWYKTGNRICMDLFINLYSYRPNTATIKLNKN